MKPFYFFLIFLLAIGCTQKTATLQIGGVLHLTGPGAFWGEGERNGALLAIEDINAAGGIGGKPLELLVEDGQTDFQGTLNAILKLVDVEKVPAIVGPTWFSQVAGPYAKEHKVVLLSPSAGVVPTPSSYLFVLWPTEEQEIHPEIQYMKSKKHTRLAVVYGLNDWSQSMRDHFVEEAKKEGLIIVKEYSVNPDEKDFRTLITQMRELPIDAIYAAFPFYPSQGEFSKQAHVLGLSKPIYSTIDTENPDLLAAYPEIEGTLYPYPAKTKKEETFRKRYQEKYGHEAHPSAAHAYDATMLLAEAMNAGKRTSEEISQYLHDLKDYPGVTTSITFDSNGRITKKEQVMKKVKDGKFVEING